MNRLNKTLVTGLTLFAVGLVTNIATADEYRHILSVAKKVERNVHNLEKEIRHYRHTPNYNHMAADARELDRLAHHIYDLARAQGSIYHLNDDVNELDRKFHHLEGLLDNTEFNASNGHGHVHGNTRHVKRLLERLEDNLHHLQEDVQNIARRQHIRFDCNRNVYRRYSNGYNHGSHGRVYREYGGYGHRGYDRHYDRDHSGLSFTIGGGSSKFRIRF